MDSAMITQLIQQLQKEPARSEQYLTKILLDTAARLNIHLSPSDIQAIIHETIQSLDSKSIEDHLDAHL
jgi:uncharacterized protein YpuA (DUF1002 family)